MNSNNLNAGTALQNENPISPESLVATQILNGFPQIVEKLSQEEYDSFLHHVANRMAEIFREGFTQGFAVGYQAGVNYGAGYAMEYATKNISAMVNMEVVNQGFDRATVLQALNFPDTEKGT